MTIPVFDLNRKAHKAILRYFIETGKPPDVAALQEYLQISRRETIVEILDGLEKDCAIYIDRGKGLISAYPFSALPTEFIVHLQNGKSVYAMCAVDALGIPLMLRGDSVIETKCHHCGKPIKIEVTQDKIGKIEPTDSKPVVSYKKAEGCANPALEQCPLINFFFSTDHFSQGPNQEVLTLEEALQAGRKSFANLLFP
jgi:hypothetical protein